jgi:hypothetical protein
MPRRVRLKELVERRFAIDGAFNFHSKVEFMIRLYPFADPTLVKVGPGVTSSGRPSKRTVVVTTGDDTKSYDGKYEVELFATVVAGVRTSEP